MTKTHQRKVLKADAPIGIFDSGVGGLTVTREIMRTLPHERLIYVGDTARCPYGPKDAAQIETYALQIGQYLVDQGVKLIVVACNTATAHALATLQRRLPVTCIGVIEPGARAAALATITGRIGVIGTQGTIASNLYTKHLLQLDSGLQIVSQATPAFVEMVEESFVLEPSQAADRLAAAFSAVAPAYLAPIVAHEADVLVMGCTHFPVLAPLLSEACGEGMHLISSAQQTAEEVATLLQAKGLLASASQTEDANPQVNAAACQPRFSNDSSWCNVSSSSQREVTVGMPHGCVKDAVQVSCFTTALDTTAFARAAQRILGESLYHVAYLPIQTLARSCATDYKEC